MTSKLPVPLFVSLLLVAGHREVLAEQTTPESAPLGLATTAPTAGPTVRTDHGYMVPYTATIPGTRVEYTMIPVPGGQYTVKRDGRTYHVEVEPFWMGKTEVTWAEYWEYTKLYLHFRRFERRKLRVLTEENEVDAVSAPTTLYDPSIVYDFGKQPNQPALSTRQYAAKQYTKWLSLQLGRFYRLPSEAEWEYACLAGTDAKYSFGDEENDFGQFGNSDNEEWVTTPAASYKPNRFGLYDMHGNVAEWVLDGDNTDWQVPTAGETVSIERSIKWPANIYGRYAKGGSFVCLVDDCTATDRLVSSRDWLSNDPDAPPSAFWTSDCDIGSSVGFRLLRPLTPPDRDVRERYWQPDVPELEEELKRKARYGRADVGLVDPELSQDVKNLPPGW